MERLRPPRSKDDGDEHVFVTLEEVLQIDIQNDEINLALIRDNAAAALIFLAGARASAFTTLLISAVDLNARTRRQWPELGVATKNSKRATTFLLPIPGFLAAAQTWDDLVRSKPSDSSLLSDSVKVLGRALHRAKTVLGEQSG